MYKQTQERNDSLININLNVYTFICYHHHHRHIFKCCLGSWGVGVQKNSRVESERGARSRLSKMQQSLKVQSLVETELG
jgi:hypothetical protein